MHRSPSIDACEIQQPESTASDAFRHPMLLRAAGERPFVFALQDLDT